MNRYSLAVPALLAAFAVLAVDAAPARAEARQVTVSGTALQDYLNSVGESINVGADQVENAQRWKTTISGNSAMTLMIEMAGDANGNSLGVYNAGDVSPALFEIFPGVAVAGQFAMASFRSVTHQLIVTLFNADGTSASGPTPYGGVTTDNFGYYIHNAQVGTGFSQDARNAGDLARMLVFKGTNDNAGNWWMCFEDGISQNLVDNRDFGDAILFVESINPTPVTHTSWGSLKSRFR